MLRQLGSVALLLLLSLSVPTFAATTESGTTGKKTDASATNKEAMGGAALPGQSATLLPNGQWLLLGGQRDGEASARVILYDPASKRALGVDARLGVARSEHTATLMPDGSVLIFGGRNGAGETIAAVESFDPATGRFLALDISTLLARAEHRATVLADGRLLVTGGVDTAGNALDDAQVLNPFSADVETVNLRTEASRFGHLAALLPAHTVLLWGGKGADHQDLKTGELVAPQALASKPVSIEIAADAVAALTDAKAPRLVNSEPADGANQVGVGQVIAVRFSKQMDVTTLSSDTVTLMGVTGIVAAKVTPVEGGLVVFVWPAQQLRPASDYSLMIKGAKDTRGQALDLVAIGFKTQPLTGNSATAGGAGTLAGANLGGGLALNALKASGASASPAQGVASAGNAEEWTPSIHHYKGSWVSGREFPHSRDHARRIAERQSFIDSLSPVAKAKLERHWKERNLLPTATSGTVAGASAQTASAVLLKAGAGSLGSVSGQVLRLDGKPLAGVTLRMGGQSAKTDASGEFLLQNVALGDQVLEIDGRSASAGGSTYGRFDYHMIVKAGRNDLNFTIWMPKLDTANTVRIPSPTTSEVVVTNPNLPGLELRIPPGSIIRDVDGKIVDEVGITPIPLDQTPFPMPYVEVPMFFTIQPGGATIQSASAQASPGARLIYPNYTHQPPGAKLQLFDYDPKGRGWYVYTLGTVSADGNSLKPDQPFVIYQFTATSAASPGGTPPPDAPKPCEDDCSCDRDGDPVACHEGLFIEAHTDLALSDTMPVRLNRVYRQNDTTQRAFGIGASHELDMYLSFVNQSGYSADAIDLVSSDGSRVRFVPQGGSKDYRSAIFQSNQTGRYYKAQLRTSNGSWGGEFVVTRKDGMRHGFSYYLAKLRWHEDRNGNRISLFRDGSGRIATVVSPNGRLIEFEYGATTCGSCITRAYDNAGHSVSYEYDSLGQLIKVTNPEGGVTSYTYAAAYRMLTAKEPLGQSTGKIKVSNEYDANGRVKKQTYADGTTNLFAYTLDASSKAVQTEITHERGDVRRITYDAAGYMLTDTRALGQPEQRTTTYTRNADSIVTDVKDGAGRVTHYDFDTMGNVVKETLLYGTADAVSWTYTYDPTFNQRTSVTDPLGRKTSYAYDGNGRLTRITDPLGHYADIGYTTDGQVATVARQAGGTALTTGFRYQDGDLVAVTDPIKRTIRFEYDGVGRRVLITDPLDRVTRSDHDGLGRVTAVTDALGKAVVYGYDANGNLTSFTDAKGNLTQWTYDERNRPVTKQDALGRIETYSYDAAGNVIFITDRKGQVTGFEYDALNRRTRAGFGAAGIANPDYQSTIAYTWDSADRLTKIVDSVAGTITKSYDERFDAPKQEVTPEGTVEYSYYGNGLRRSMTHSGGTQISYAYDDANRLTGIGQAAGTGSAQPAAPQNVSLGYDEADRRTSLVLPNGIRIAYTWDEANQLTGIGYQTDTGTVIGDLSYGYDAAGQRIKQGGSLAAQDLPATEAGASYDANNRLTDWNGQSMAYDANGNLIADGVSRYTWNSRNQLVAITGATSASFAYDGLGRRRGRNVAGVATQYLYDGLNAIQEQSGNGAASANLLGGLGLDEWYGRTEAGTSLAYVPDALGSVLALADANQSLVTRYTYEPYGTTTASGATSANSLAYTGRENDGTGLYYYRARYYHPGIGRFVSEDPIGLDGGYNLYTYVDGSPLSFVDPTGEIAFVPILVGVGIGLAFDYALSKWKEEHCKCQSGSTPAGAAGNAAAGGATGGSGPFASKPRGGAAGGGPSGTATSSFSQMNHAAASSGWYSTATRHRITGVLRRVPYAGAGLAAYEVYDAFSCD